MSWPRSVKSRLGGLADRLGLRGERSYALNELDLKLDRLMDGQRGGYFIEAGGNDGVTQSNTLFFERFRGWRGLLIEPIPELAVRCAKNRPRSIVESVALVPLDFEAATVEMRYCNLMSLVKGGMPTAEEEAEHLARGSAVQQVEAYDIEVPARSLQSILDSHGIRTVDLFVLDIEGFEAQALRGIDFNRFVARNLLIEARYRGDVEAVLDGRYGVVAQLSHHDLLYRPVVA